MTPPFDWPAVNSDCCPDLPNPAAFAINFFFSSCSNQTPEIPSPIRTWFILHILDSCTQACVEKIADMVEKIYVTYNQIHKLCQEAAQQILDDFKPNLMIAIGGGGYVPARILRSFLKRDGTPNIPIQAIGLSLYEQLGSGPNTDTQVEVPGKKVTRTQWLDLSSLEMANLIGKNVLIVDEVDDTRTTLEYAVRELQKDVEAAVESLGRQSERDSTRFSIFVLHNKDKPKKGVLPQEILNGRYSAARTVGDVWINYPWEARDIDEHDRLSKEQEESSN